MHERAGHAAHHDILLRLRDARRALRAHLARDGEACERVFAPESFLGTLRTHIERSAAELEDQRCSALFALTVLLYGALEWQFSGLPIDVEADVQLERIRQNQRHGGPEVDDRLSPQDWLNRLRYQMLRLEQQLAADDLYAMRLIRLAALAQAALEASTRRLAPRPP